MAKRKKGKHKVLDWDDVFPEICLRRGAPNNLRPAGAHQDKKQKELNKILKKEIQDETNSPD